MKRHKIIIFMLPIMLLIVVTLSGNAATKEQVIAGNQLNILGIFHGYEDGSLKLDNNISRAEMTTLLIRVLGYEDKIVVGSENKKFSDVEDKYWASENIKKASSLGIVSGYPDNSFKPKNNITYSEVLALMVRVLKKDKNIKGDWPYNYINKAKEIRIITDEDKKDPNKVVTRGEVAELLWSTLLVKY